MSTDAIRPRRQRMSAQAQPDAHAENPHQQLGTTLGS
jgi:hypothetical protein